MSDKTLEKVYKAVLTLQEQMETMHSDMDTLAENDCTFGKHLD